MESFVVRVRAGLAAGALAGEVEVVATGRRAVFRSAEDLVGLLVDLTAAGGAPSPPGGEGPAAGAPAGEVAG
ncbi:hypothetical protein PO878_05275 [Iamia majanohamensis]|uniref:Uncharacterized protein n=1 Tax=Iamia majanohamensis TaxID=467976 RepID=A0AAE9Y7G9_9ACTN|nr:hypothetical protein [Iamia majanohamensis]WCO68134.1 hypothetical protein PO878_05275 [Iamia majanohamensis]